MTNKLTYWDRSPQESTQSAGDCTSRQRPQRESLWYPSTQRYLQQPLTWHGVSSQVSHTLKRLTPTAPPKLICIAKPKAQTKILAQHSTEGNSSQFKPKKIKNERYVGHHEFTSARCPEIGHREFMYSVSNLGDTVTLDTENLRPHGVLGTPCSYKLSVSKLDTERR